VTEAEQVAFARASAGRAAYEKHAALIRITGSDVRDWNLLAAIVQERWMIIADAALDGHLQGLLDAAR
jgi:hypothetical protein